MHMHVTIPQEQQHLSSAKWDKEDSNILIAARQK
jgi:hypothetical protein